MSNKDEALKEFLSKLLKKFGNNASHRKIISNVIRNYCKNIAAFSVEDSEYLERKITERLGIPASKHRLSLSPTNKIFLSQELTPKSIRPSSKTPKLVLIPIKSPMNEISLMRKSPSIPKFREVVSVVSVNKPEHLTSVYQSQSISKAEKFPSPFKTSNPLSLGFSEEDRFTGLSKSPHRKRRLSNQWEKITKADQIMFENEQKFKKIKNKELKKSYSKELLEQMNIVKEAKEKEKQELLSYKEDLDKSVGEFYKTERDKRIFKRQLINENNAANENIIKEGMEKQRMRIYQSKLDAEKIKKSWEINTLEENAWKEIKAERLRKNAEELKILAEEKEWKRKEAKLKEIEMEKFLLDQSCKKIIENENKRADFVKTFMDKANDEERLSKLHRPAISLLEYEREIRRHEEEQARKNQKEENSEKLLQRDRKIRKKMEDLKILSHHMEEKALKKREEEESLRKARKEINDREIEFINEEREKLSMRMQKQKDLREALSQQMKDKEEKEIRETQFSPAEAKYNKKIIETALKVLGEN
ncbi:unnamed protein product [Blepharisma stoltei]|uniref:Trichohyalin-plectin-homology domain-containing protein n=1 Tax=Blepharisma stoltei TaxID=1481888 RepID=A0AAU9K9T1_9CILI|nr:unnamed protein product [Blepharisma stoltei]